ncbi:hypothetical protein CHS0354_004357 [Potamilus streckersoni]|uniref:Uncharacterized protein n=1 Tax=Potamilus streckersoni TaxID=2493646 RepID=A0AAE0SFW2_9BIVA|nr:hypothetical protein CHS0354_004357 [Potamilus streckersoni]
MSISPGLQLAGYNRDPSRIGGFTDLRWAQTANYGFVPNARLQNVFMSVAMDLPDFNSTYGAFVNQFGYYYDSMVEDEASRLVLAARAVAYGEKGLDFQGPYPSTFNVHGSSLTIEFSQGKSPIQVRSNSGFEVSFAPTKK